jgi:hypothetical protein
VVSEIWKRRVHAGEEPDLYFWRDSAGHEVDLVIDAGSASGPIPLEIKSGETVAPDAFAGLDYWNRLAGRQAGPAALVHAGDASFTRRGTVVRPWSGF